MLTLQISDAINPAVIPELENLDYLYKAVTEVLLQASPPGRNHLEDDLAVVLSDDALLQELNRQYLGIDAPTDVLSFPSDEIDLDSGQRYLGDILISLPRAQEQAHSAGHPLQDELRLLVVHGVLHLLGYDHDEDANRLNMWAIQSEILRSLGSSIDAPAAG
jgi:probable rRNA maturation factor